MKSAVLCSTIHCTNETTKRELFVRTLCSFEVGLAAISKTTAIDDGREHSHEQRKTLARTKKTRNAVEPQLQAKNFPLKTSNDIIKRRQTFRDVFRPGAKGKGADPGRNYFI